MKDTQVIVSSLEKVLLPGWSHIMSFTFVLLYPYSGPFRDEIHCITPMRLVLFVCSHISVAVRAVFNI